MKAVRLLAVATLAFGCGHQTAQERQLADLQDEVTRIQESRDKEDQRITALEIDAADSKDDAKRPTRPPQVPPQRTVAIGEDGSETTQASGETAAAIDGDDPSDTTPRPSIRVVGTPGRVRGKGGRGGGNDVIEESVPDEAPNGGTAGPPIRSNAPAASALDANARSAYDAALALVNSRQYDKALDALSAFLVRWPDHPNADNAMYWRGECYFAKGDYMRAVQEFEGTIARFPMGNKVPDALLKLGISYQKLGNAAKAKTYFDRLLRDFPRSEAARRIPAGAGPSPPKAGPQESP